ncbi:MAG TPA: hypothetical protein VNY24_08035 [Candidatus Acidoferrales bacterium]|jgi:hypothetical protein|nr:hypothetical protein [Candidatus Acidoferrales bacterium]
MPNITENLWNSTRDSSLYCVWVPVRDDGGDRLAAIWIDPALNAFKSCAPETSDGIGPAATHFAGPSEEDANLCAGEHLTSTLPRRS